VHVTGHGELRPKKAGKEVSLQTLAFTGWPGTNAIDEILAYRLFQREHKLSV
jgi:hypothetical protein